MRKHFALPLCLALTLALSACEPTTEDRLTAAEESASQALDSLLAARTNRHARPPGTPTPGGRPPPVVGEVAHTGLKGQALLGWQRSAEMRPGLTGAMGIRVPG
ncbi:hypothetical protein [Metapseudomonas otitidis]|uniref:hypothetical protein n=1 Tax=Metapseudomonas otitidis TaxID=319939 RepID=UPI0013F5A793|nr:hypothetical protein [Pseudomonas otitidis]